MLPGVPPFTPPDTILPNVFFPPISSRERIEVGIDSEGKLVSVDATQRLVLARKGDYRVTVPAPAEDVEPAPGSDSQPGLRRGAIIWQGFSPGGRVLAARAELDPRVAGAALPLRVEIARSGDELTLRLRNLTATTATTYSAVGERKSLLQLFETLRRDPGGTRLGRGTYVQVSGGIRTARVRVDAPLRVHGPGFDALLGGGRPSERVVRVRSSAPRPRLVLEVEPVVPPFPEVRQLDGRALFDRVLRTSLTLARVRQYRSFLANPDPLGPVAATYVYRTVPRPSVTPPPKPEEEGLSAVAVALIALGCVVAAGGLIVLWAHS